MKDKGWSQLAQKQMSQNVRIALLILKHLLKTLESVLQMSVQTIRDLQNREPAKPVRLMRDDLKMAGIARSQLVEEERKSFLVAPVESAKITRYSQDLIVKNARCQIVERDNLLILRQTAKCVQITRYHQNMILKSVLM